MIADGYKLGYDDVSIVPIDISPVSSRSEIESVIPYLWVSPMDTVVDNNNIFLFCDKGLNVPMVRGQWKTISFRETVNPPYLTFTLNEVKSYLTKTDDDIAEIIAKYIVFYGELKVLIDIANGHMEDLLVSSDLFLEQHPDMKLVTGNIAFPETIKFYKNLYAIRLGIGSGSRCLTSSKTGVHYPMISLIDETQKLNKHRVLLIADGGIRNSSDMCKAFAAGANGVMMGGIFNKVLESAGKKYISNVEVLNNNFTNEDIKNAFYSNKLEVDYRGMSTIQVQMKEKGFNKEYEEGYTQRNLVNHTLDSLLYELDYAFKSMLSYNGAKTLNELYDSALLVRLTPHLNHNNL